MGLRAPLRPAVDGTWNASGSLGMPAYPVRTYVCQEILMCRRVTCPTCNKPTWAGCGQHIEQALAGVPKAERCACGESIPKTPAH